VDRFHEIVGIRGQKTIEIVGREAVPNLPNALPCGTWMPAKNISDFASSRANQALGMF